MYTGHVQEHNAVTSTAVTVHALEESTEHVLALASMPVQQYRKLINAAVQSNSWLNSLNHAKF